jgi:hypothetical protein
MTELVIVVVWGCKLHRTLHFYGLVMPESFLYIEIITLKCPFEFRAHASRYVTQRRGQPCTPL